MACRSRRTVGVVGAVVLLALAAGAVYLVQRYHSARQLSPRTLRATDFTPTPVVPLADMHSFLPDVAVPVSSSHGVGSD